MYAFLLVITVWSFMFLVRSCVILELQPANIAILYKAFDSCVVTSSETTFLSPPKLPTSG